MQQPVFSDKTRRVIKGQQEVKFDSYSSFHLLKLTARAKSEKQLGSGSSDDEDLTFNLDGRTFPKLNTKNNLIDSPAAFSGGSLHNLAKTVYLLIFLRGKNHTLVLNVDNPSITAALEGLDVWTTSLDKTVRLDILQQAEDGDRRPWVTFALAGLPLKSLFVDLTLERRYIDSDDVKVVVDGKIQINYRNRLRKYWFFLASAFNGNQVDYTFPVNLPSGLHYLELYSDRMPTLTNVVFNFGTTPPIPFSVPTADSPKWTGDFYDDPEEMLLARAIFGEAEGASEKAKVCVGWTIKNRVLEKRKVEWGLSLHEVILKENQYEAFVIGSRLEKMRDPLRFTDEGVKKAWFDSYRIAVGILEGTIPDPTHGATNYYSTPIDKVPYWATKERERLSVENLHFYRL